MEQNEKIEKLKKFANEKEFRLFLIDLLARAGYENIEHTHKYGDPEFGKDILCSYPHPIDEDDWYSFVVKVGRISAGTNEIETIKNQVKQSYEYGYKRINGGKQAVSKVKVVTNENFTGGAEKAIRDSNDLKIYSNYSFLKNTDLIKLIDNHFEEFWLPGDNFSKQYGLTTLSNVRNQSKVEKLEIKKIDEKKIEKLIGLFIKPTLLEIKMSKEKDPVDHFITEPITFQTILDGKENFIISGQPGSGKTKIVTEITNLLGDPISIYKNKTIPVSLNITDLREAQFNLKKAIDTKIDKTSNIYGIAKIRKDYSIVLLIDGFDHLEDDEMDSCVPTLKKEIEKNKCKLIITKRSSNHSIFDESKISYRDVRLQNFNFKQVENYVSKYFENEGKSSRFIDVLKESNLLSKLPTTPLTITILSILYDDTDYEVPATITDIYSDFTAILLGKLELRSKKELIAFNILKRIISSLALEMLVSRMFEIPFDKFVTFADSFLTRKGYGKLEEEKYNYLIDRSGVLYTDESNLVKFKYMSFIEYYAAHEIYHHRRNDHYKDLITNFTDPAWQNTAVFFAGMSKDMPDLINDLIEDSKNIDHFLQKIYATAGYGFVSQALYETDATKRIELINLSLENMYDSYNSLKDETAKESSFFKNLPVSSITSLLNIWFSEHFKSVTLRNILIAHFMELEKNVNSIGEFDNDFKLFLLASTLLNKYIDEPEIFERLLDRESFMSNQILVSAGDVFLTYGDIKKKNISSDKKKIISRRISKSKKFINSLRKKPAYLLNEEMKFLKKGDMNDNL